jgi:hypothetical protein
MGAFWGNPHPKLKINGWPTTPVAYGGGFGHLDRPPLNFFFFLIMNLVWGHFEKKKKIRMVELQKFESLGGALQKLKYWKSN